MRLIGRLTMIENCGESAVQTMGTRPFLYPNGLGLFPNLRGQLPHTRRHYDINDVMERNRKTKVTSR